MEVEFSSNKISLRGNTINISSFPEKPFALPDCYLEPSCQPSPVLWMAFTHKKPQLDHKSPRKLLTHLAQ